MHRNSKIGDNQRGLFNPIALREAKIIYNFGLSECNKVKVKQLESVPTPLSYGGILHDSTEAGANSPLVTKSFCHVDHLSEVS